MVICEAVVCGFVELDYMLLCVIAVLDYMLLVMLFEFIRGSKMSCTWE